MRRENQQRRMRERSHAKGLSASFLESDRYDDEGEDLEQSLLAIKNKYKKKLAEGLLVYAVAILGWFWGQEMGAVHN